MFNAQDFLTQTANQPLDTRMENVHEGEYKMVADDVQVEEVQRKKDPSKPPLIRLSIQWNVIDEAEKARLGREKITVRQQFLLDTTDAGTLDWSKGKNIRLGQIFEAMGMNDGTGSIGRIMGGGMVSGRVAHRANPDNPEIKYAEVVRVARA